MKTKTLLSTLFFVSAFCFGLTSCSKDDDNVQPPIVNNENTNKTGETENTDFSKVLPAHWANTASPETIGFFHDGSVVLQDLVDNNWGVSSAKGTYTLSGNLLTANFTRVEVLDVNWNPTTYHGFTDGKSRTVKYTIVSCDGKKLVMKDENGKTLNYEKYADAKD